MPRIDPLKLLICLSGLLAPNGGIRGSSDVKRLTGLMGKFCKKLVSKCIYIQILKCTETELLGEFMSAGGWMLAYTWLNDGITSENWPLVQEILELMLLCPVDVQRLKINSAPKLVKLLSKEGGVEAVRILASKLVEQWLKIVKGETMSEVAASPTPQASALVRTVGRGEPMSEAVAAIDGGVGDAAVDGGVALQQLQQQQQQQNYYHHAQNVDMTDSNNLHHNATTTTFPQATQFPTTIPTSQAQHPHSDSDGTSAFAYVVPHSIVDDNVTAGVADFDNDDAADPSGAADDDDDEDIDNNDESETDDEDEPPANEAGAAQPERGQNLVFKITMKDGKQVLAQVQTTPKKSAVDVVGATDVVAIETNDDAAIVDTDVADTIEVDGGAADVTAAKSDEKRDGKTSSSSTSKSSKSSRSDRDKDHHRSSSSSSHRTDRKSTSSSSSSSSSKKPSSSGSSSSHHKSSSSSHSLSHKSSSSSSASRSGRDEQRDRHRSAGSKSSSSSSSSSSAQRKSSSTTQAEKDKDTLNKIMAPPSSLIRLGKIPKKPRDSGDAAATAASSSTSVPIITKKPLSMSIEVRNRDAENRPKTVKTFNSKFRSHGLAEEAPPPPSRRGGIKKPTTTPSAPGTVIPSVVPAASSVLSGAKRRSTSPSSMTTATTTTTTTTTTTDAAVEAKKPKIDLTLASNHVDKPGAIKLISPKPKPSVLMESDMFMDALSAATTSKKDASRKRKRRSSPTKDLPPTTTSTTSSSNASSDRLSPTKLEKLSNDDANTGETVDDKSAIKLLDGDSPAVAAKATKKEDIDDDDKSAIVPVAAPMKFYQDTLEAATSTTTTSPSATTDKTTTANSSPTSGDDAGAESADIAGQDEPMDDSEADAIIKKSATTSTSGGVGSPDRPNDEDTASAAASDADALTTTNATRGPGPGCGPDGPPGVLLGVLDRRRGPKKQLRWRPAGELEEIRYFELDENERCNVTKTPTSFGDMKQNERTCERDGFAMARKLLPGVDTMTEQMAWSTFLFEVEDVLEKPSGVLSKERDIQAQRELGCLKALYFNRLMVPDSPAEPDFEMSVLPLVEPLVIPLEDVTGNTDGVSDFTALMWPDARGSPPLAATAGGAAAAAASMMMGGGVGMVGQKNMMINDVGMQMHMQPPMMGGAAFNGAGAASMPPFGAGGGGGAFGPNGMPMPPPSMQNNNNNSNGWNAAAAGNNNSGGGMMMDGPPPGFGANGPPPSHMNMGNPPMGHPANHMNGGGMQPPPFGPPGHFGGGGPFPPPNGFNDGRGHRGGGGGGPWMQRGGGGGGNWRGGVGGGGGGPPMRPPWAARTRVCKSFAKGFCRNGNDCNFLHPGQNGPPLF